MPSYDFDCKSCQVIFEITQSIKEELPKTCPVCNNTVTQIFNGVVPFVLVYSEPTTVKGVSEKNVKRMGKDYFAEKKERWKQQKLEGKRMLAEQAGGKLLEPKGKQPFWDSIDSSKITNVNHYIDTGKE